LRALCSDREVMALLYGAHLDMTDGITGVERGIELRGMVARPPSTRMARPRAHRFRLLVPDARAIELKDGAGVMVFGKVAHDARTETLTVSGPLPVVIRIFTTADEFDLTVEDQSAGRWRDLF
jgi:hypothetical protein